MLTKTNPAKLKSIKVTPETHAMLCGYGRTLRIRTLTETVEAAVTVAISRLSSKEKRGGNFKGVEGI